MKYLLTIPLAAMGLFFSMTVLAHDAKMDKSTVEAPHNAAPSVKINITPDAMSGWNLHIMTTRFRFTPGHASGKNVAGEGHAHLMVNGKKIARVYGNWFHIAKLPGGEVKIKVGLYANDHRAITVDGKPVFATATIEVPGS